MKGDFPSLVGKCTDCGLCFNSCPGIEFSYPEFNHYLFPGTKSDCDLGNFSRVCFGRSSDEEIRNKASAGGVVTGLVCGLLKKNIIKGAVVVGAHPLAPCEPKVKLADTPQDIVNAAQSKYSMIALNAVLRETTRAKADLALVGLPCHIHGIRKLQKMGHPAVANIKYCIGLFCGLNLDKKATSFLINKLNLDKNDIFKLEYRGGKWPGGFRVTLKNGKTYFLQKDIYNYLGLFFTPQRCLLCPDLTNEFADISMGDAWNANLESKRWSSIIVRTDKGREILNAALSAGDIEVRPADISDIKRSHAHLIAYKKSGFSMRQRFTKNKPRFDLAKGSTQDQNAAFALLSTFLFFFMRNKLVFSSFNCIPLKFIIFLSKNARLAAMRISNLKKSPQL